MGKLKIAASLGVLSLALHAAVLPRKAPELAINLNSGKTVQVNTAYRGKVICVAFILTTCPHCQNTIRILTRAQNDYGARGFQVAAAAIEENAGLAVPGFIQQFSPPFPVGFLGFQIAQDYMQHSPMLIMHMPGIVFLDRQGSIVAQYEGDAPFMSEDVQEKNIRTQIEKLLGSASKK